ncbi:MAG: carbonic anhydrase family protein [Gemmatimonadota bacterium]|jgi:carbonic anhydrase
MTNQIRPTGSGMLLTLIAVWTAVGSCAPGEPEAGEPEAGPEDHGPIHWGYEADDGPAVWGSMDPEWALCAAGEAQSPIDLTRPSVGELPEVTLDVPSDQEVEVLNQEGVVNALDNGHTVQINVGGGETLEVGGKTYSLVQFHFHAPSEHTLDGEHFPMEMHFVHEADDGALAVVGLFVEEGAENPSVASIWERLAAAPGSEATVRIPPEFGQNLFSGESTGAYYYSGSLTTPPCSEGVSWYVRRTPTELSAGQIEAFTAVYDHNNRPVQPLNDRMLQFDESPTITVR